MFNLYSPKIFKLNALLPYQSSQILSNKGVKIFVQLSFNVNWRNQNMAIEPEFESYCTMFVV